VIDWSRAVTVPVTEVIFPSPPALPAAVTFAPTDTVAELVETVFRPEAP
jgi:hypothetical protein